MSLIRSKTERLAIEGSPPFNVTISDLAASASMVYGFDDDRTISKYLPLNFLRIVNNGGTDLKVYINQGTKYEIIINNTIYTYTGILRSFILANADTSNTATGANIYTTVQRKPGAI